MNYEMRLRHPVFTLAAMNQTLYLDSNATTAVLPAASAAASACMAQCYGNPSSSHSHGLVAKHLLEQTRAMAGAVIGVGEGELVFTSGATEAIQTAVLSALCAIRERRAALSADAQPRRDAGRDRVARRGRRRAHEPKPARRRRRPPPDAARRRRPDLWGRRQEAAPYGRAARRARDRAARRLEVRAVCLCVRVCVCVCVCVCACVCACALFARGHARLSPSLSPQPPWLSSHTQHTTNTATNTNTTQTPNKHKTNKHTATSRRSTAAWPRSPR